MASAPGPLPDDQAPFACPECHWKGTVADLDTTDGPDDLERFEVPPVAACPKCRWWFSVEEIALARQEPRALLNDAAPDMLAALKRAARNLGENSCNHDTDDGDYTEGVADDCTVCIVHAAIARAEGAT